MPKKIEDLHRILRGNYASQWNEDTDFSCKQTLKELAEEIGMERLEKAVLETKNQETFFQAQAIRRHIPPVSAVVKRCGVCQKHDGFVTYLRWVNEKWSIYAKKCEHNANCLKCGDTGWVVKYGCPGSQIEHFEACNCIAGDRLQPRGAVETNPSDQKLKAAGE